MLIKNRKPKRINRKLKEPFRERAMRAISKGARIAVFAIAIPTIGYSAWTLYNEALTTPYLAVHSINVNGSNRVAQTEILKLSGLHEGQNIFSFSKKELVTGIRKNPWVAGVFINREFPDTVLIDIVEREPVALVKLDALYIMDSKGNVFKKLSEENLDLPIVTGLTVEETEQGAKASEEGLLELIGFLKDRNGFNLNNVSEINVDPFYGFSVFTLEEGIKLEIGRERFKEKLDAYEAIIKKRNGNLNGIEAMDLNNEREVIVRFNTNVIKEGGVT